MNSVVSGSALVLAALVAALGVTACAHTPALYALSPAEAEGIRSDLRTVGVAVSRYEITSKISRPAKGPIAGAGRGMVAGAVLPVAAGAASPIPGGAIVGLIVVPVGAVVGMGYGAVTAVPAREVDAAEAVIDHALARLQRVDGQARLRDAAVQLGSERTGLQFVALVDAGPSQQGQEVRYDQLKLRGTDTVLELSIEKGGLWALYTIDPPSSAFLDVRARLIRVSDNAVLLDDKVFCASDERTYLEWAENDGQPFFDAIVACIPRVAEKVIDDFFLVYPLARR